jgi:hypothetical protein
MAAASGQVLQRNMKLMLRNPSGHHKRPTNMWHVVLADTCAIRWIYRIGDDTGFDPSCVRIGNFINSQKQNFLVKSFLISYFLRPGKI